MDTETNLKIENESIRKNWNEQTLEWEYSIVDVVALVTKSTDPRNYWKVLKNRLKKAQNKLVTECNQLKLPASDGKMYLTDTANAKNILEIIKIIAPQYRPSFKQWFDKMSEKLDTDSTNLSPKEATTLPQENNQNTTYPQPPMTDDEFVLLVDGYRENNFLIVQAFVAGLDTENLFISATCDTLTISGARRSLLAPFGETINSELAWGKFSRTIELPTEIDLDEIQTKEKDGMITILLPIKNKNISRRIKLASI